MKRKCCICSAEIPNLNQEQLMDLQYSGVVDNFTKKHLIFCPKHSSEEICEYITKNKIGMK